MKRKIISLVIILSMILSFVPGFQLKAYAADEPTVLEEIYGETDEEEQEELIEEKNEYIRVRVEGFHSTLFNKVIPFTADMNNALDVLKAAVGEENIEGSESTFGYLITSIMREQASANAGWQYFVELYRG